MRRELLEEHGQVSLDRLAAAFREAPSRIRCGPIAELRIVAVRIPTAGGLATFAAHLDAGLERASGKEQVLEQAGSWFIRRIRSMDSFKTADDIEDFALGWRRQLDATSPKGSLQTRPHVNRQNSDGHDWPHWRFELHEPNPIASHHSVPSAKLWIGRPKKKFFPSLPDAAAYWLKMPEIAGQNHIAGTTVSRLWDQRGAIKKVRREGGSLRVTIVGYRKTRVICHATFDSNTEDQRGYDAREGEVVIPLPRGAQTYKLFLTIAGDFIDDRFGIISENTGSGISSPTSFSHLRSLGGIGSLAANQRDDFIDRGRIEELNAIVGSPLDPKRLIGLCEELNKCCAAECWTAAASLTRAILNHVPPAFGHDSFDAVVANAPRSHKKVFMRLNTSARAIADASQHLMMQESEVLPTRAQVDFRPDLDVLIGEVVRRLRSSKRTGVNSAE